MSKDRLLKNMKRIDSSFMLNEEDKSNKQPLYEFFNKKYTYADRVRDCLFHILMEEFKVSEKDFKRCDELSDQIKELKNNFQEEINDLTNKCEDTGKRAELCAEILFEKYFNGKAQDDEKKSINENLDKELPEIFKSTFYRIPTKEELININSFNLNADDIVNGFRYTIIGKRIKSQENQEKIAKSIKMLSDLFPDNVEYKKALNDVEPNKINESIKRDDRKTLNVEISNLDESDFLNFQKLFGYMNFCASAGAGRKIELYCDGDGAFRAKFKLTPEPEKINFNDMDDSNDKLNIGFGC